MEDDPVQLAKIINDVHDNPCSFLNIKDDSKEFIRNNFTWDLYEKKLLEIIQEVCNSNQCSEHEVVPIL